MTLRDFQKDFNKNFKTQLRKLQSLAKEISGQVLDQAEDGALKRSLNSALDLLRPHSLSLGLRIARLSDSLCELVIPRKDRNLDEQGHILEGVLISSAVEAFKILLRRNLGSNELQIVCKHASFELLRLGQGDLRVRANLPEIQRESLLAELGRAKQTQIEAPVLIFEKTEQLCAQVQMSFYISQQSKIEWK
jgi:hypothetical protein